MTQPTHKLFLSYAWGDDPDFVKKLYEDLTARDFKVWWDQADLVSRGAPIRQELNESIRQTERILPVIGPAALESKNVQLEWQYARHNCMVVTPILRLGEPTLIPADWRGAEAALYFDFRDDAKYEQALAKLLQSLGQPVSPLGKHLGVPDLPTQYVPRKDQMDALRRLVLADIVEAVAITSAQQTTTLHGMGGIGKSVVAAAFAHDCAVRRKFSGGILWLTVGREPNVRDLLAKAGSALGDRDPERYRSEAQARESLHETAEGKTVLLILDDVWEGKHARPFREALAGTSCQLLVTTRRQDVTTALEAQEHKVGLFDEAEAVALIEQWTGKQDPDYTQIARKLDCLPLAIRLAGALLAEGYAPQEWLKTFDRVSRIALDTPSPERNESLDASIGLSVEAAFPGEEADRVVLYHTLGVFREDVRIPQAVVLKLWKQVRPDLDEFTLTRTVDRLVRLALVERSEDKTITLHDLLHSYNAEKLGNRMQETHHRLLEAYDHDGSRRWASFTDDGYLYEHLAYHLTEAGRSDELFELLTGSPDWMAAKFAATFSDRSYHADLSLALSAFVDPLTPEELLRVTQLFTAQNLVGMRVSTATDTALRTLVYLGRKNEALGYARLRIEAVKVGDGAKQCYEGLRAIYQAEMGRNGPDNDLPAEMAEVVNLFKSPGDQSRALVEVGSELTEHSDPDTVFRILPRIHSEFDRDKVAKVAYRRLLSDGRLGQADELRALLTSLSERPSLSLDFRGSIELEVAQQLAMSGRIRDALTAISRIKMSHQRAEAYATVARLPLSGDDMRDLLTTVRAIVEPPDRALALSSVGAAQCEAGNREEGVALLHEALEGLLSTSDPLEHVGYANLMGRHLLRAGEIEAGTRAMRLVLDSLRNRDMAKGNPAFVCYVAGTVLETDQMDPSIRQDMLQIVLDLEDASNVVYQLGDALLQAGEHEVLVTLLEQAFEQVRQPHKRADDASSAVRYADLLGQAGQPEKALGWLDSTLDFLAESDEAEVIVSMHSAEALKVMALISSPQRSLKAAKRFEGAGKQAAILRDTVEKLVAIDPEAAIAIASQIKNTDEHRRALEAIIAALDLVGKIDRAMEVVESIEKPRLRKELLTTMVPKLAAAGQLERAFDIRHSLGQSDDLSLFGMQSHMFDTLIGIGELDRAIEMIKAEVISLVSHDISGLTEALAAAGRIDEAVEVAHYALSDGNTDQSEKVAEILARAGHLQQAAALLEETQAQSRSRDGIWGTIDPNKQAGEILAWKDRAAQLEPTSGHDSAGRTLEVLLAEREKIEAQKVSKRSINDILALAANLSKTGASEEAAKTIEFVVATAREIPKAGYRSWALCRVSAWLLDSGYPGLAHELCQEAQEAANEISDSKERSERLDWLADLFARAGDIDSARSLVGRVDRNRTLEDSGRKFVTMLADAGRFDEALHDADTLIGQNDYSRCLVAIARSAAKHNQLAAVLPKILSRGEEEIKKAKNTRGFEPGSPIWENLVDSDLHLLRLDIYTEAALGFAETGQPEQSLEMLQKLDDEMYLALTLPDVIELLAQAGKPAAALEVARMFPGGEPHDLAMGYVVRAFLDADEVDHAVEIAAQIHESYFVDVNDPRSLVADRLTERSEFKHALTILGSQTPNKLIKKFKEWGDALERARPGLAFVVLRESARIAGWVVPQWNEVYQLLNEG